MQLIFTLLACCSVFVCAEVAKPVEWMMSANVFQRSGETWKDVTLLSTGNPTGNATPSQLRPWTLGYYDPGTAYMRSRTVQPGVVMGRITNEQNEPVPFALVMLRDADMNTISDANGFF